MGNSVADRIEWVNMINIVRRSLQQKDEYRAVDPTHSAGTDIIIDIEISSLNRKKSIRVNDNISGKDVTALIISKFPDVPMAGFEVFLTKYQKFLSDTIDIDSSIKPVLGNRDRVDLRKRRK